MISFLDRPFQPTVKRCPDVNALKLVLKNILQELGYLGLIQAIRKKSKKLPKKIDYPCLILGFLHNANQRFGHWKVGKLFLNDILR